MLNSETIDCLLKTKNLAIPKLRDCVQEVVAPPLSSELDIAVDQVNARLGAAEPTVAIRLEEIPHVAQEGHIDTNVVAEDETL